MVEQHMAPALLIEGTPYPIEAFGDLVIPKDCLFYTQLPYLLASAKNEAALQDLMMIVSRIRRSRGDRYWGILEGKEMPNLGGINRNIKGTRS
jgi:hypothetical protein